jgi:predicted GIY-YIG superfamily endonuclease
MFYVYLLQSSNHAGRRYVGVTEDLRRRLVDHNAGASPHTAKFRPWRLVTYIAFSSRWQAQAFERYIKSGSGHAFARKRLWPDPAAEITPCHPASGRAFASKRL